MDFRNPVAEGLDRVAAARLLAEAEGRAPVSSARDVRVFAGFAAVIGLLMGLGTVAMMFSGWAVVPYVVLLFAAVFWHRRALAASPRGAGRTYVWGVVGSGVMVCVVVTGLHVIRTTIGLTPWWFVLGVLVVALPGLVSAVVIARRGVRR